MTDYSYKTHENFHYVTTEQLRAVISADTKQVHTLDQVREALAQGRTVYCNIHDFYALYIIN